MEVLILLLAGGGGRTLAQGTVCASFHTVLYAVLAQF